MRKIEVFDKNAEAYDLWYEQHKAAFQSEAEAIRLSLPPGESHGIEVGLGTGRFCVALGIKEGVEPAAGMREIARARGIEVMNGVAEKLPYRDMHFDFVLMSTCVGYLQDIEQSFREAYRVLKRGGRIILGSLEKNGIIAKSYEARRSESEFYHSVTFFDTEKLVERLRTAGFSGFEFRQTLFGPLDEIQEPEPVKEGYGEGSFVVIVGYKNQ